MNPENVQAFLIRQVNALVFDAAGFIVNDLDKDRDLFAAEEHLHRALVANCEARAKEAAFIRNASALLQQQQRESAAAAAAAAASAVTLPLSQKQDRT